MLKKQELTAEDQRTLLHWLLVANAFGHYTTSTETTLNADLAVLHRGGSPADLLELVKQQFGRIEFTARDFERRSARHGLFATTYLALRHQGARDWGSALRIALTHQGRYHYIEWHHIFPRSVLSQRGNREAGDRRDREHGLHQRLEEPDVGIEDPRCLPADHH
jgi:hypothetical protein